MTKVNRWYILAKVDKRRKYGFTAVTPKGKYYTSLTDALVVRNTLNKGLVILKRSCQPLSV